MIKSRREILKNNLSFNLLNKSIGEQEIELILKMVDEYQKKNLDTITKLKKVRKLEFNKIKGGLKQSINAHGPITKELIGSATKRIWGALLTNEETLMDKLKKQLLSVMKK